MKLEIFTICFDAMPFIGWHLPVLNQLNLDWRWTIAEGAAMNVKDTSWCRPQSPRLSTDGTTAYLNDLKWHPRIRVIQRPQWNGKVEMCNACLEHINEPCVLMQMDADELWSKQGFGHVFNSLQYHEWDALRVRCRYFVGPDLIITSNNTYGNKGTEWMRAWSFEPGMRFLTHEPPVLSKPPRRILADPVFRFEHYAYTTERQVKFRESFYGYKNAVAHWKRLQANTNFPARLRAFLPWVNDNAVVDRLFK